jgi:carbon monoxide dehydrogenase subunit G
MKVERSVSISRPPADLFGYVADVRNDPAWHTDVREVRSTTGDSVGVGTVYHVRVKPSMGVNEGAMTVTRYEPPRVVVFEGQMGRMRPTVTTTFEPDSEGTRVTRRVELDPPGIFRLFSSLIGGKIGRDNDRFLANLKRVVEGSTAPP